MDPVSKWLIITRACVFTMTILSALIGGLLAAIYGDLHVSRLLIITLGLVIAHGANNMVTTSSTSPAASTTKDYPRAKYAPHPLLDNLVSKEA